MVRVGRNLDRFEDSMDHKGGCAATLAHPLSSRSQRVEDVENGVRDPAEGGGPMVHSYFETYDDEMQELLAENDQRGFCKHLKGTVGMWEGTNRRVNNSS